MPAPQPFRRPVGRPRKSGEERVAVNARLPLSLHRRLRAFVAGRRAVDPSVSQNDVLVEATDEYLTRRGC